MEILISGSASGETEVTGPAGQAVTTVTVGTHGTDSSHLVLAAIERFARRRKRKPAALRRDLPRVAELVS